MGRVPQSGAEHPTAGSERVPGHPHHRGLKPRAQHHLHETLGSPGGLPTPRGSLEGVTLLDGETEAQHPAGRKKKQW